MNLLEQPGPKQKLGDQKTIPSIFQLPQLASASSSKGMTTEDQNKKSGRQMKKVELKNTRD